MRRIFEKVRRGYFINKKEVIRIAGRTPLSPIDKPSLESPRQPERFSGVSNSTTSFEKIRQPSIPDLPSSSSEGSGVGIAPSPELNTTIP